MYTTNDHIFAVCAYKESPFLEECVRSLMVQTEQTSCIICTSTPNEHISEVADRWGLQLFARDGQPNIADDWNFAADCALGERGKPLVTIAHQDDIYLPEYAQAMLEAVDSVEKPLLFFTNYGELRNGIEVDNNQLLAVKRKLLAPFKLKAFRNSRTTRRRILAFGSAICCPSVTICTDNVDLPVFEKGMKSNLDWQAWERISREKGAFLYDPRILMYHRIHEESETSNLIKDDTRAAEDLFMYEQFWPKPIARLLNKGYAAGRESNNG